VATPRDALYTQLLNALRGMWRGGRQYPEEQRLAVEAMRELRRTAVESNEIAEQLARLTVDLNTLPASPAQRRQEIERIGKAVKAIQPLLGIGASAVEIGKLNSALGEKRAGRPAPPRKTPTTPASIPSQPPDAPITSLHGVGEKGKRAELIATIIHGQPRPGQDRSVTIEDVLRIQPRRHIDYSNIARIGDMLSPIGEVTIEGEIIDLREHYGGRPRVTARVSDGTGAITLTWFSTYIGKQLNEGDRIYASGTIRPGYSGGLEMVSPEWEYANRRTLTTGRITPVYPLTKGISQKVMRTITRNALDATRSRLVDWLADAREFLPPDLGLVPIEMAYEKLHYPDHMDQVTAARRRLQFENQLLLQIGLVERKRRIKATEGRPLRVDEAMLERYATALPFSLTSDQRTAIGRIANDLQKPVPMTQLLQGDVGSGKTAVAAAVALIARDNGTQTAVMAPTELLAEQHLASLDRLYAGLPQSERPNIALLTGSTKAKERKEIANWLTSGEIDILVGTHALVQDNVAFHDLALVIVDEQHRFGVRQRAALAEKANGIAPHVLSMTATPIPRTLNFVLAGDLDVTLIRERPKGRLPIVTRLYPASQRQSAYALVRDEVAKGHQIFVICPLVEESEAIEAKAAVEEAERLQRDVFPDLSVDVVHGRMSAKKKDEVMTDFRDRTFDILVSTSVIEVGIDIPNATVMMIEGADRFGLAQLHQFRGRVGRGDAQSYCLLLADNLSRDGQARLSTMVETDDGFLLAQRDLELRGPGDFIGTRQSGLPELDWLEDGFDTHLLEAAHKTAERIVDASPNVDIRRFPRLKPRLQHYWRTASPIDTSKT
jgi:ATP-dependent DNA helicase RecG